MPLSLETLIGEHRTDLYGEQANLEAVVALATRLPYLPVCNIEDLRRAVAYSRDPDKHEQENRLQFPDRRQAYAWTRLPRFLDGFHEARSDMRSTYPNSIIQGLDVGSSFPLYSEMMRSHWLRKCGDHAQQALSYTIQDHRIEGYSSDILQKYHLSKNSDFRRRFISCLQVALYCIPYELSGDDIAIKDYLYGSASLLMSGCVRHIDRRDRKESANLSDLYSQLGVSLQNSGVRTPMERAWRIDAFLEPEPTKTCVGIIKSTQARVGLSTEGAEIVQDLARRAKELKIQGDQAGSKRLLDHLGEIVSSQPSRPVDDDEAALILDTLLTNSVEFLVQEGFASPARFLSLDLRSPADLLEEAESSFDAETKSTGFYRRVQQRFKSGDPDHIHDDICEVGSYIGKRALTFITSIDSYPFYAPQPSRLRDVGSHASDVAANMALLASRLNDVGRYITFPWGNLPPAVEDASPSSRIARQRLLPEVIKRLARQLTRGGGFKLSTDIYDPEEVESWMSRSEHSNLLRGGMSTAFDPLSGDPVEVLRISRAKRRTPVGTLLSATPTTWSKD